MCLVCDEAESGAGGEGVDDVVEGGGVFVGELCDGFEAVVDAGGGGVEGSPG